MAAVCRFYRMSPIDYRLLTIPELDALTDLMEEEARQRKRDAAKTKAKAARVRRR